jgi:hypothetical protein
MVVFGTSPSRLVSSQDIFPIEPSKDKPPGFAKRNSNHSVDSYEFTFSTGTGHLLITHQIRPAMPLVFEQMVDIFMLKFSAEKGTPFSPQQQRNLKVDQIRSVIGTDKDISLFIHIHIAHISLVHLFKQLSEQKKVVVRDHRFFIETSSLNETVDQSVLSKGHQNLRELADVLQASQDFQFPVTQKVSEPSHTDAE